MNSTEHVCPLFKPVGNVKEHGGTSCGNCVHFNSKHIINKGVYICKKYADVVALSTNALSNR